MTSGDKAAGFDRAILRSTNRLRQIQNAPIENVSVHHFRRSASGCSRSESLDLHPKTSGRPQNSNYSVSTTDSRAVRPAPQLA